MQLAGATNEVPIITCAKLCRAAGGELEQIQLLLGHASVQTTERYLGTKQDLVNAPNDGIKLKVWFRASGASHMTLHPPYPCSSPSTGASTVSVRIIDTDSH